MQIVLCWFTPKKLDKHNEALNHACNRFLLSEPKFVTKNGIIYLDLLPGPLLKQKYFVAHTHKRKDFFCYSLILYL